MPGNRTVLHQAAEGGHHGIIRALSRVGADVHAQDGHGLTPLATAMLRGKWLAALELMRCGACPNVRVCETERAFLRALKIARESEANLVSVYWCGGSSPALSDKFIEAADGARAYEAKCAFIVVHVSLFFYFHMFCNLIDDLRVLFTGVRGGNLQGVDVEVHTSSG